MIEVVDNFASNYYCDKLYELFLQRIGKFPWYISETNPIKNDLNVVEPLKEKYFYFVHNLLRDNNQSSQFDCIEPLLEKIKYDSLIRVKANCYLKGEKLIQHEWHRDYQYKHYGALFYVNTCDGFTEFECGTKVSCVRNRIVFFDPSKKHRSSNTTNCPFRFTINFNYQ